jgi:hypothetical protein
MVFRSLALAAVFLLFAAPGAGADEARDKQVTKIFMAAQSTTCRGASGMPGDPLEFDVYEMSYTRARDDDATSYPLALYRFFCDNGAYNISHVFYAANSYDEITQLQFAEPVFEIDYADEENEAVRGIALTSWTAMPRLVNSEVDVETGTVRSYLHWRGLGDASSRGTWRLRDGRFELVRFEVDASYDGEINPLLMFGALD